MRLALLSGCLTVLTHLHAATLYVSLLSTSPQPPYSSWDTAAHVVQDAVDAAQSGDTVLVGDGTYLVGQRWLAGAGWSRVEITNAIVLRSVNGPQYTWIYGQKNGSPKMRCVYLGHHAVLDGFGLDAGSEFKGGGVMSEATGVVTNCFIQRCYSGGSMGGGLLGGTAYSCRFYENSAWYGGGAARATLHDCTFSGNSATIGGGVWESTLNNCVLTRNRSSSGGAANESTLTNCILTENEADEQVGQGGATVGGALFNCTVTANLTPLSGGGCCVGGTLINCIVVGNTNGNYTAESTLDYCLTHPLPTNGVGNIDAEPLFIDAANHNHQLSAASPCIDAGTNYLAALGYASDVSDILGNFRGFDGDADGKGDWDIGAFEYGSFKLPRFASEARATQHGFQFFLSGEHGKQVTIERSVDLVNWEPWVVVKATTNSVPYADPTPGVRMFYRGLVD